MTTIAIIGAGPLGGATAHALASSRHVGRVLFLDSAADAASGKALDLQQCGAVTRSHVQFEGSADWSRLVGCAVCVLADRFEDPSGEWRNDEGLAMLSRSLPYLGEAPIVFAGTSQTVLLGRAAAEAGIDRRRLVGSATVALALSISAIVAIEARCSSSEVTLSVLGVPPAGFVVPWSGASIGGASVLQVLSPPQLNRVETRASRLWPPGPYALGAAASRVVETVLENGRQSLPVLTWLTGEYGVRNRAGVVHAALGASGIRNIRVPELTSGERARLLTALGG